MDSSGIRQRSDDVYASPNQIQQPGALSHTFFYVNDAVTPEDLCKLLVKTKTDVIFLNYNEGKGLEAEKPDFEWVGKLASLCHKEAIKIIGRISIACIHWSHFLREEPRALEWTVRDSKGRPLNQFKKTLPARGLHQQP